MQSTPTLPISTADTVQASGTGGGSARRGSRFLVALGFAMLGLTTVMDVTHHMNIQEVGDVPRIAHTTSTHITNMTEPSNSSGNASMCLPNLHTLFGRCSNVSKYCYDDSACVFFWEPRRHCKLPPPQTFWTIAGGATTKGLGIALVFKTKVDGTVNKWKDYTVIAFTLGQTFVSVSLLIFKAWSMSGFETWWGHSQCWGMMLTCAPWTSNFVLYAAKMKSHLGAGFRLRDGEVEAYRPGFLLKAVSYKWMSFGSFAVFVIFNGVFTITNLIPNAVCYIWMLLLIFFVMWALNRLVRLRRDVDNVDTLERELNFYPLLRIPVAITLGISLQWFATTSVYLYDGSGYWCAAWESTTERRSDIYFGNFRDQILRKAVWLTELINEFLP